MGTVDGYLITQRRRDEEEKLQEEKEKHRKKVSYKYAIRTHLPQKVNAFFYDSVKLVIYSDQFATLVQKEILICVFWYKFYFI